MCADPMGRDTVPGASNGCANLNEGVPLLLFEEYSRKQAIFPGTKPPSLHFFWENSCLGRLPHALEDRLKRFFQAVLPPDESGVNRSCFPHQRLPRWTGRPKGTGAPKHADLLAARSFFREIPPRQTALDRPKRSGTLRVRGVNEQQRARWLKKRDPPRKALPCGKINLAQRRFALHQDQALRKECDDIEVAWISL